MNIASVVSALQRVRPRQQQPGVVPDDETERAQSYSQPQPDVATSRVAPVPVATAPEYTPQAAFNRSMTRIQGTPAPDPFATRISPAPAAPAGQVDGHVAQDRVSNYEDIPMPPKAPELADVRPSTPMPTREMHHGGVGSRLKDAAKFGLRSLLLSGGNPLYAMGAGIGALVNPQAEHDQKYNREMDDWQPRAKAEMNVIEESNKGKIQQGAAANQYYDNLTKREDLIGKRETRFNTAGDRVRGREDTERTRRHQEAKDVFDAAFKAGQPIPESLRGSAFEPWIGKTLAPHERDRITAITNAQSGEVSRLNLDTGERIPVPGVAGRVQQEPGAITAYQGQELDYRDRKDAEARQEKASAALKTFNAAKDEAEAAATRHRQLLDVYHRQHAAPTKGVETGPKKDAKGALLENIVDETSVKEAEAEAAKAKKAMLDSHRALGDFSDEIEADFGDVKDDQGKVVERHPYAKFRTQGPKGRGSTVPRGSTAGQRVPLTGGPFDR